MPRPEIIDAKFGFGPAGLFQCRIYNSEGLFKLRQVKITEHDAVRITRPHSDFFRGPGKNRKIHEGIARIQHAGYPPSPHSSASAPNAQISSAELFDSKITSIRMMPALPLLETTQSPRPRRACAWASIEVNRRVQTGRQPFYRRFSQNLVSSLAFVL